MNIIRRIIAAELPFFYAAPAMLWQLLFLYIPLIGILVFSMLTWPEGGSLWSYFTLEYYRSVLEPVYAKVLFNSLIMALWTGLVTLLVAYPVAYYLAMYVRRGRMILLFALILPSWTNFIVQMYAWFFLLERGGLYSRLFYILGLTSEQVSLFNNFPATILGMVYGYLPFMIFPLYVVLERLDKRLIEASTDLGANRLQTFWRVFFPLSLPGVYAGFLLVFIPAFGEFAVPILLGGSKKAYWGSVIMEKFLVSQEFASGFAYASLGILFLVGFLGIVVGSAHFVLRRRQARYKAFIMAGYVTKEIKSDEDGWSLYGR